MADCTLFDEDEICVCSPDKGVIYGLVVENSEYVSSDEYSDGDDAPDRVKRGTVRVSWHPDGKEAVLPEKDLCLADRSLMPGDVVRRLIEGKDSQRGYVIDINSYCHLKVFGTDKFIYNVNTSDLHPLQAIDDEPGDVTLDSWVGKIDSINKSIILRFADDARCEVDDFNLNSFEDVLEKGRRQSEFFMVDCFPGQTLRGEMGELGSAKWIHATNRFNARVCSKRPYKKVTVLVESVSISSVEVHWVCKGFNKVENPLERFEPPPEIVHGENLQRLRALDTHHSSIQLGDRCYYDIKATDVLETKPPSQFPPLHVEKQQVDNWYSLFDKKTDASAKADNKRKAASSEEDKSMGDSNIPNKPIPLEKAPSENLSSSDSGMVNGFAAENVSESQEGNPDETIYDDADDESDETCSMSSEESTHSASSLSTKKSKNLRKKNATVTATFKKKKKGKRPKSTLPIHVPVVSTNPGDRVPVDVCYTFSVASVMWQDGTVEKEVSSVDLFPIHHLDELEFFPGDYVVNSKDTGDSNEYGVVVTCDHAERTCLIKHMKAYEVGKASSPTEVKPPGEVSVYDIKDHPYYKFRPGQVVIRVGGFEKSSGPLEAAGLVKETNSDGRITVKWADNVVSPAYPQELYIIGGEMSEAGSDSEWETDSDSEAGEGVTDGSWETEDEEVLDGVDSDEVKKLTAETSAMENGLMVSMAVDRLSELEALLTRSQEALERSDQALGSLDPKEDAGLFGVAAIYLDIVKICKHFDKIWKSSYFSDQTLTTLIDDLKSEIRKGKAQKIVRHLSQVYAAWVEEENNKKEKPQEVTERKDEISNTCSSNTLCKCDSEGASACATKGTEKRCKSEKSTSEPRDSKSHFANARTLCHTIYTMLRDKMKLIQEEVDKVGKQNCGTRSESQVVKKPETANMHSQTDESSLSKQNGTGGDNTEKRPATMENGDSHPENVEMSKATDETFEGAVASTPVNSCGNDGVLETMDNIIQMFVSNLPCLPDSCLSSSGDESSLQARYKEVEETEPSPQGSGAATTNTKDFHICESAPGYHKFRIKSHVPTNPKAFMSAVRKELTLLKTSLPDGIFVKAFEDRMDLFSIMITGPANTPYEDGLFFFDVQLPNDYPKYPPSFHYYSYCDDRLNPNLYEDGKVCVSLLGTWSGKGNEVWTNKSNMLQVLISIQGLILVSEPYYNEAGFEKQRGTQQGLENSKMYNEMAALKLTQSMAGIAKNPPAIFRAEAHNHLQATGHRLIRRLKGWVKQSDALRKSSSAPHVEMERPSSAANGNKGNGDKNGCGPTDFQGNGETALQRTSSSNPNAEISSVEAKLTPVDNPDCSESQEEFKQPEFPLLPASKGFCMTIHKHINNLSKALENIKAS